MTILLKLGPADHSRPIRNDELAASEFVSGYKYEVIDGKLYVSYEPDLPENLVEEWLYLKVRLFTREHPEVINYATNKARVFIPDRPVETIPEPDLAAYRDFPFDLPYLHLRWEDVSPVLVGEVLSRDDPDKDLVRNVNLYLLVPSIREYWILDPRRDPERPMMRVYRRRGSQWQRPIKVAYGETYTTKLLPGFELLLDPRR